MNNGFQGKAELIWSVANLLRGNYKQADYGKVILPFTVLRRLDSVLAPTRVAVRAEAKKRSSAGITNLEPFLTKKSGFAFYNESLLDFDTLLADPANLAKNLKAYIEGFSLNVRDVVEEWKFSDQIDFLAKQELLYLVTQQFRGVDLSPGAVTNHDMGLIFEDLIRRFSELSNETAGEHFTPREVVQLAVDLLLAPDDEALTRAGVIRSVYDPTAGTGGMLSVAEEHLRNLNAEATIRLFGQELNPESYSICKADILVKGQDPDDIVLGNTLSAPGHRQRTFDYLLANPPFGVEWKNVRAAVEREYKELGYAGRFGPGLPRVSDGSLLFLLHMLSHMKQDLGSRVGIVLNGSPLFTGDAGGGESEIRRWIIENDWLEAIIALPHDMFYNTGIATYIWILSNRKAEERRGLVQLINAVDMFAKMPKSLGSKRKYLTDENVARICQAHGEMEESAISKLLPQSHFGYRKVTIQRPLRVSVGLDEGSLAAFGKVCEGKGDGALAAACANLVDSKGVGPHADFNVFEGWLEAADCRVTAARRKLLLTSLAVPDPAAERVVRSVHSPKKVKANRNIGLWPAEVDGKARVVEYESDASLRDFESVPLAEDVVRFVEREVFPFIEDAWIDADVLDHKDGQVGKVGYEINFPREFQVYQPPRPVAVIHSDIKRLEEQMSGPLSAMKAWANRALFREDGGRGPQAAAWPIQRLKTVADARPSNVDKKSVEGEDRVSLCNYMDVYNNESITRDIAFMEATAKPAQIADFALKAGDVLATKDSETPDDIGVPSLVRETMPDVLCAYHLTQIRPTANLEGGYLLRVLQSHPLRHYFKGTANGVTRFGLNSAAFNEAPVPVPPVGDQREIVAFLDHVAETIDALQGYQAQLTEVLAEYRAAIITAAVTGQIDVSERCPPK